MKIHSVLSLYALASSFQHVTTAEGEDCITVRTWRALVDTVAPGGSPFMFCPFRVSKPDGERLLITKNINLACSEAKRCIIGGEGNHIQVQGIAAHLTVTGFTFIGATESAIEILETATKAHTISQCAFRSNYGSLESGGWGGAVRTNKGTNVTIVSTRFLDNQARSGGALAHLGTYLRILNSIFTENLALHGGGIFVPTGPTSFVEIESTKFLSNVATSTPSGAISVGSLVSISLQNDLSSVMGTNNVGCDGIYDVTTNQCSLFSGTLTPSSFEPGKLTARHHGIRLSQGLTARTIARAGEPVSLTSHEAASATSSIKFRLNPDGAAVFELDDGGFVYVSNSEEERREGGVFGLEFDSQGNPRGYKALLTGNAGTSRNCNGGTTPWNTWVSCEEVQGGQCWQVDPTGDNPPEQTDLGGPEGGFFEAFAYDYRDTSDPSFYVTEDQEDGALRRFRPNRGEPFGWNMLHNGGTLDYLQILPGGKFRWTSSILMGRESATKYFKNSEGIAHHDGILMFVSKVQKELIRLNLDKLTYTTETTRALNLEGGGSFGDGPDHLLATSDGTLYFTEDGGSKPGVFVYDGSRYLTLLEADAVRYENDETTGIAFSPDGKFMFVCIQEDGVLFQVSRIDGRPFEGRRLLEWKYDLGQRR